MLLEHLREAEEDVAALGAGTSRQLSQASRAVSTARFTSAAVERGKDSITSPVEGFNDSKVAVAMRRS